eukprot:14809080-Heterocapsa_arctica.AAC.2
MTREKRLTCCSNSVTNSNIRSISARHMAAQDFETCMSTSRQVPQSTTNREGIKSNICCAPLILSGVHRKAATHE